MACPPRPLYADELSDLEKAYGAYLAHHYDQAEERLRALLNRTTGEIKDPESMADARMYLAAVLISEGKKQEAGTLLETLLLDKPDYQPDPLRIPLPALDALIDARLRLRDKLVAIQSEKVRKALEEKAKIEIEKEKAAIRLATLERLASEEVVVEKHSRFEALIPFGVGQFQNGQVALGWTFLSGESLLALGSAIGYGLTYYNENLAYQALQIRSGTAYQYETRAQEAWVIGTVFTIGLLAAAVGGVVHAEATFVPEHVQTEPRRNADSAPQVLPTIGLGAIGVVGKF